MSPANVRHVGVVGGGLAGFAAATALAERGVRVTLFESNPHVGGRLGAWTDDLDGETFQMERGFHAFFRCYYNLRNLLKRFDPELRSLTPVSDYPILGADGSWESFAGLPKKTPFNLIALVKRTPSISLKDLVRIPSWPTLELLAYDEERTFDRYDHVSAGDFLDALNFPPQARQLLFDVFAHSFFNPQYAMSAAEMIKMFHLYFTGNPEGLLFDVLKRPFSEAVWTPLMAHLRALGADIRVGTPIRKIIDRSDRWSVACDDARSSVDVDAVVLATSVPGLKAIVEASPDLGHTAWRQQIEALHVTRPFAVWRLWLDRRARPDRPLFAGTAGLGLLDNISLYDRIEDESRRWAEATGGSVVELHGYALPEGITERAVREDLWRHFITAYPEFAGAKRLHERLLLKQDCPRFAPGDHASRPTVKTPLPGLFLAGDFVRLPVPSALMEGAVTSGFLAANLCLERWDVRGVPIRSVPRQGIFAGVARHLNREDRFAAHPT